MAEVQLFRKLRDELSRQSSEIKGPPLDTQLVHHILNEVRGELLDEHVLPKSAQDYLDGRAADFTGREDTFSSDDISRLNQRATAGDREQPLTFGDGEAETINSLIAKVALVLRKYGAGKETEIDVTNSVSGADVLEGGGKGEYRFARAAVFDDGVVTTLPGSAFTVKKVTPTKVTIRLSQSGWEFEGRRKEFEVARILMSQ